MKKAQKLKRSIWKFIREMIPVMLGVYFAFALSDYSDRRKTKEEFQEFKTLLAKEITQNRDNLKPTYEYHQKLKEDFDTLRNSDDPFQSFSEYELRGIRPGFVSSSAYKTGLQTGIIHQFDLDWIIAINNLYTYQEKYDDYNKSLLDGFISQKIPEDSEEVVSIASNLIMSMNDVLIYEKNLIKYYEELQGNLNQ